MSNFEKSKNAPGYDDTSKLGPVVDEFSELHLSALIASLCFLGISLMIAAAGYFFGNFVFFAYFALGVFVAGIVVSILSQRKYGSGRETLRHHELGISHEFGELKEIAFSEIDFVAFELEEVTMDDCTSYATKLHVKSTNSDAHGPITILHEFERADPGKFRDLANRIAETVGERLAAELSVLDKVEWIPGVTIYRDGIEAVVLTNGSEKPQRIGWEQIGDVTSHGQTYFISLGNTREWDVHIDMRQPGFWPGYHLFKSLCQLAHERLQQEYNNRIELDFLESKPSTAAQPQQ